MTYTHRASDEIRSRLDDLDIDQSCLWAGTIHAFASEWILRPYAPYHERLRKGFRIADERETEVLLRDLKEKYNLDVWKPVVTRWDRQGQRQAAKEHHPLLSDYSSTLVERGLLDFDDVLLCAYEVLCTHSEVAETLAGVCALFCIDEVQDTQDLQYAILSAVVRAGRGECRLFCVGDPDQAIYESLGAVVKTAAQIKEEFGLEEIHEKHLSDNYRSTQRIVDAYRLLRPGPPILSRAAHATEHGLISFHNQTVDISELVPLIAGLIRECVDSGVSPEDVCVVAPHWEHVRSIARSLVVALPNIAFDAPGLSPVHSQRDSITFKLSRLLLTTPEPKSYGRRMKWARDIILDLSSVYRLTVRTGLTARALLKMVNGIEKAGADGLSFVEKNIETMLSFCSTDSMNHSSLVAEMIAFIGRARERASEFDPHGSIDVPTLMRFFQHPSGVTVQTCHGVKGEEFDTVIAFGLLRGYVPNWDDIIGKSHQHAADRESKLLYVLCSRAKRRLHLIAERGRTTKRRKPYDPSPGLSRITCNFDQV